MDEPMSLAELDRRRKLADLWCELNAGRWDREIMGPEPEDAGATQILRHEAMKSIERRLSEAELNYAWWQMLELGSDNEWVKQYHNKGIKATRMQALRRLLNIAAIAILSAAVVIVVMLALT